MQFRILGPLEVTDDKPVRVAAYIRVSSARQANEGDSLTAQKHEIEQEIEYRCRRKRFSRAPRCVRRC